MPSRMVELELNERAASIKARMVAWLTRRKTARARHACRLKRHRRTVCNLVKTWQEAGAAVMCMLYIS